MTSQIKMTKNDLGKFMRVDKVLMIIKYIKY